MDRLYPFSILPILFFIAISFTGLSSTIKGNISDSKTGEPLTGAIVYLKNTKYSSVAGLDGSYLIQDVPPGSYEIFSQLVGYATFEKNIVLPGDQSFSLNIPLVENQTELSEVVITGTIDKESDASVRRAEQKVDNVLNIMGARSIELLPDITVGNVLQRVSGVSIVRNSSGDGQYAIIRGMDKRYNYTLVNGVKIPSPDNKNRYVPLDIFPSDLLERLEVIKAVTPSMEGDAIGGAMNMVMKSAPKSLSISATAATGYSDILNSNRPFSGYSTKGIAYKSPEAVYGPGYEAKTTDFGIHQLQYTNRTLPLNSMLNLSIGNRVLKDKLGILAAVSYQNIFRGTNSTFYVPDEPAALPYPNTYLFQEVQIRQFSTVQNRFGALGKLDYSINEKHKISLSNLFVRLEESQHRNYYNPLGIGAGLATNDVHDRSRFTVQTIYNSTLRGDHLLFNGNYKLNWTAAYSLATSNTPAWADMNVRYRYNNMVLQSQELLPVTQRWTNNQDEDKTGYINLSRAPLKNLELAVGGMARFKTRNNVYAEYELNTLLPDGSGNYEAYTSIDKATFLFLPATNAYANPNDPNNYTAKENISAYYIQAKYNLANKLQILGGVRNENTHQEYHSQLSIFKPGKDGKIIYSDVLPSLHLKYALSEKENLRLSYYSAISRPNYFEFVPTEISGDVFTESGNYNIKHTTADNYDIRYELFNGGSDQVLAGAFYKKIKNPIEYGFVPITVSTSNVIPQNYGVATNYGLEFVITKYIRYWGVTANYTYTHSAIVQSKKYKATITDSNGGTTIVNSLQDQTRPLQGQSDHIANVSFLYKNPKAGLDAQLSWVYTGRRINIVSPYKDLDYWQRGFSQLDFSAEKRIFKNFKFFVKITNLLDASLITEVLSPNYLTPDSPAQDKNNRIVVQKDVFHQTFLAGLRFKL
ncbi:MAG TPA: TonB-dependent receptor [Cyclobacteriaceae bacterium]|nr:TonB-dependent receptor [Cyclobacteriaceae bacterium]